MRSYAAEALSGIRVLAVLTAAALCLNAAQYTLDLSPSDTKIDWTVGDVLHTVHGTFKLKSGSIAFDTSSGKASGRIVVDVTSGDSGSGARDKRMHANVLESQKYPEAIFIPDHIDGSIQIPGTSDVKIRGAFTIHGAIHELTMSAKADATTNDVKARLTFEIPYVSWGMKDPSNFVLKVSKTVEMSIDATGALKTP